MTSKTKIWWKTRVLCGGLRVGKRAKEGGRFRVLELIVLCSSVWIVRKCEEKFSPESSNFDDGKYGI